MKCANCGRERPEGSGSVIKLTEDDQAMIQRVTGEPSPTEFFYCTPCYRIVTDPELGARMISGQLEMRLRMKGHPKAQQIAEGLYKLLKEQSKNKKVS